MTDQTTSQNDGPEGHNIGTLWPEANSDPNAALYASQAKFPHNAWQQIITPFITAYKANGTPSSEIPPSNTIAVGTLWYKTILQNAYCPNNEAGLYGEYPRDFNTSMEALNWAVILSAAATGYKVSATSNGAALEKATALQPGANFGQFLGVQAGSQTLVLQDSTGKAVVEATNGTPVSSGCPDGIYNMNYRVIGLQVVSD